MPLKVLPREGGGSEGRPSRFSTSLVCSVRPLNSPSLFHRKLLASVESITTSYGSKVFIKSILRLELPSNLCHSLPISLSCQRCLWEACGRFLCACVLLSVCLCTLDIVNSSWPPTLNSSDDDITDRR